jgi:hypothetical protein
MNLEVGKEVIVNSRARKSVGKGGTVIQIKWGMCLVRFYDAKFPQNPEWIPHNHLRVKDEYQT